ncbi:LysR family transcriptional regulator [Sporosarcina sp. 179-K 3D1 HS]|uniref:LysR family transcriptional regulator n=1 Tax=Sporosarcina sp. 179-K 3D1 HS TaxID=3232169 RepID=UPI0039A1D938
MEIHQLQYVVNIAKYQQFTRAADEICVSQSTLSQQVTKLEDELGVKLFERTTRSVKLTSAGKEFLLYAKRILSDIDRAKHAMKEFAGLSRGKIKIGAINSMGDRLPFLIADFQKLYPGINVLIMEEGSYKLLEMLETYEIDIAILTPPTDRDINELIEVHELIDDELVLITSKNHPLAKKNRIDLREAAEEKFIFPSRGHSAYNLVLQACRDAKFEPEIVCESSSLYARFGLVGNEMGVSLVSSKGIKSSDTEYISIVRLTETIKKPTVLALLKSSHHSPATLAFRNFLLQSV